MRVALNRGHLEVPTIYCRGAEAGRVTHPDGEQLWPGVMCGRRMACPQVERAPTWRRVAKCNQ